MERLRANPGSVWTIVFLVSVSLNIASAVFLATLFSPVSGHPFQFTLSVFLFVLVACSAAVLSLGSLKDWYEEQCTDHKVRRISREAGTIFLCLPMTVLFVSHVFS